MTNPRRWPDLHGLLRGSAVYGAANVGVAGTQFVSVIVFATLLSPADFGYVSIFSVLFIVLSTLCGLGLSAAVQQSFFKLSESDFAVLVSAVLLSIIATGLLLAILLLFSPPRLVALINLPAKWILIAIAVASMHATTQVSLIILQTTGQLKTYLRITFVQVASAVLATIAFAGFAPAEWESAVVAQICAPVITSISAVLVLRSNYRLILPNNLRLLREALTYSLPLVPHQLAAWAIAMADRFIIVNALGVAQAGVYSLAFQIAQSTNIVSNSINQAIVPLLFSRLSGAKGSRASVRMLNGVYGLTLGLFSVLFVIAVFLAAPFFLKSAYQPALVYIPWLIFGFLMLALSRIASNFLLFYGRTGTLAASTMSAAVLSILLNLWLVPEHGLMGACWTSAATFSCLLVVTGLQAWSCHRNQR